MERVYRNPTIDAVTLRLRHQLVQLTAQREKIQAALDALEGYEEQVALPAGTVMLDALALPAGKHPLDTPVDGMPPGGMKGVPRRRRDGRSTKGADPKSTSCAIRAALAAMKRASCGEILAWITKSTVYTCRPTLGSVYATLSNGKKRGEFRSPKKGVWEWTGGVSEKGR